MDKENLIHKKKRITKKKVQCGFNLQSFKIALPFLIIIVFILPHKAFADNDQFYSFTPTQNYYIYGQDSKNDISFHVSYSSGDTNNNNFNVYDCNGNLITSGSSGTITYKDGIYPIKFVCTCTSNNYRIDLDISQNVKQQDYSGLLDSISNKIDGLINKIQELIDKLKELADYLDNPKYLKEGQDNLSNAVQNMENYAPFKTPSIAQGAVNDIKVGSSPGLPSMNVTFFKGTQPVNVLDLSAVSGKIDDIKNLMRAILWVSLFLYFIGYFMPKLKI